MDDPKASAANWPKKTLFLKASLLLMSAYFVFWACAPTGPMVRPPPMAVTQTPNTHQLNVGGGATTGLGGGALSYRYRFGEMALYERFMKGESVVGGRTFGDLGVTVVGNTVDFPLGVGVNLRAGGVINERVLLALRTSFGLLWVDAGLDVGVRVARHVSLYISPGGGTHYNDGEFSFVLPLGVSFAVSKAVSLTAEALAHGFVGATHFGGTLNMSIGFR
jgi:hypothetical protein